MIVSYDTIMKPPFEIDREVLQWVSTVSEKIGRLKETFILTSSPQLRKQNQIKSIHASLRIEGNTLSERQMTAIIQGQRVIGPAKDIQEVENALKAYDQMDSFKPHSQQSFLKAHKLLMQHLVPEAGNYRKQGVGIMKGDVVQHMAPPASNVTFLMKELFMYLKNSDDLALIKSCVFHYEVEFIHPFMDGNGRIGRLWQSVILASEYPVFKYIPFENLVAQNQQEYYKVLSECDKQGQSTKFIIFMLKVINEALDSILKKQPNTLTQMGRLQHFITLGLVDFTRKDYRLVFKNISPATASRDLKMGVEKGYFKSTGDKRLTHYEIIV